jgi:hypothetical protein
MSGGMTMREDFEALGFDARKVAELTMELQDRIVREMAATEKSGGRGLLNPSKGFGPAILDLVHPRGGMAALPVWKRRFLDVWTRAAKLADRALA